MKTIEQVYQALKSGTMEKLKKDAKAKNKKALLVFTYGRLYQACPSDRAAESFLISAYEDWENEHAV